MNMLGDATMNTSMSLDRVERLLTRGTFTQCIHTNDNRNDGMSCVMPKRESSCEVLIASIAKNQRSFQWLRLFHWISSRLYFFLVEGSQGGKKTLKLFVHKRFKTFCCVCDDYCLKFVSKSLWKFGNFKNSLLVLSNVSKLSTGI